MVVMVVMVVFGAAAKMTGLEAEASGESESGTTPNLPSKAGTWPARTCAARARRPRRTGRGRVGRAMRRSEADEGRGMVGRGLDTLGLGVAAADKMAVGSACPTVDERRT